MITAIYIYIELIFNCFCRFSIDYLELKNPYRSPLSLLTCSSWVVSMVTPLISIVMHVQVLDTIEIDLTQRILGCSGGISPTMVGHSTVVDAKRLVVSPQ